MVAMLVAAENATSLPRLGSPRIKLSVHASQTCQIHHQFSQRILTEETGEGKRTGANGRLALRVDLVEEAVSGIPAVARERVHHPAIGRDRERAAEEHRADNDHLTPRSARQSRAPERKKVPSHAP